MTQTKTNYQQQATDFLAATGTTLTVTFLKHGKHFDDDKDDRDIYQCELKRGSRSYKFNFGQSIACSGEYQVRKGLQNKVWCEDATGGKICLNAKEFKALKWMTGIERDILKNPDFAAPTAYSILSCLTKYDCGSFKDFCSEFGYDTDSKKAEKTYNAVKDEYTNVCALFTDKEIEQLQEIN